MSSIRSGAPITASNLQAMPNFAIGKSAFWGRGIDGPLSIGNSTFDIASTPPSPSPASPARANYAACLQVSAINGTNTVLTTVGATTSRIFAGDHVLVINVQGSAGATANVGKWERAVVLSVTTNSITLVSPLARTYGNASNSSLTGQVVIVQRLPEYTDITLTHANAIVTAPTFNTSPIASGICAFLVNGTISGSAAGKIDMSGRGYRGGAARGGSSNTGQPGESLDGQAATYTNSPGGCGGRVGTAGIAANPAAFYAAGGGGGAGGGAGSGGRHAGTVGTGGGNGGGGGGGQGSDDTDSGGSGASGNVGGAGGTGNPSSSNGGNGGTPASPATTPPSTYGTADLSTITLGSGGGGVGAGQNGGGGGNNTGPSPSTGGTGGTSSGIGGGGGAGGAVLTLNGFSGTSVPATGAGVGVGGNGGGIVLAFARNVTYGSAIEFTSGGANGGAGQNGGAGALGRVWSLRGSGPGGGGGGSGGGGGGSGGSTCLIAGNITGGSSMVLTAATSTGGAGGSPGTGGAAVTDIGMNPTGSGGDGGPGTSGGFGGIGRMYVGFFSADGVYAGRSADVIGGYAPVAAAYKGTL